MRCNSFRLLDCSPPAFVLESATMNPTPPPSSAFHPHIGWFGASMIIVGSMIGSGIFFVPSVMAQDSLTPGVLIGLWVFGGLFTLLGALCYGELAAMIPHAGGQYVYLREAFNPLIGFLYGWTLFLVIQSGFNAAVSIGFAKALNAFVPAVSEQTVLLHLPLADLFPEFGANLPNFLRAFTVNTAQLVACGVIIVLTGINMLGVREGALVQNVLTVLKVLGLGALIVAGLSHLGSATDHFQPVLPGPNVWQPVVLGGLAVALSQALFAYDAWNTATFVAEEVENPHINLPRALFFGTGAVIVIYVLTVVAYMVAVPFGQMAAVRENRIAEAAAIAWFGDIGVKLIVIAILISTFGCVNGLILSGARVAYAMAREGLFFRSCASLHAVRKTPIVALIFQGVWSCLLTLTGSYGQLLTYTSFASVLFGALTVIGLYRLRALQPDRPRPYRCWGYPVTPALYLLIAVPFLVFVIYGNQQATGIGLLLVLSGLPVYWFMRRSQSS
jgi:APA family basic amino acid/polyamine antiporter